MRGALAPLRDGGWRMPHSLRWHGGGDIDSVAIAPTGLGFATNTSTYDERQLGRVREQAGWLGRRGRRWCHRGALPVLCVVRATGVERYAHSVCWWSRSTSSSRCCGESRMQWSAVSRCS